MVGRVLLVLLSLSATSVLGTKAKDNFLIQIETLPSTAYIQLLNQQLDCIGNKEDILRNTGSQCVHRRLVDEHLHQAMAHIKGNRVTYAPFFEFPIDIAMPSEDDTDNDEYRIQLKQLVQQHYDAVQEDDEKLRQRSRYEQALKIQKAILLSDITIATTTIQYARSVSSLNGTAWQAGIYELPSPRESQFKGTKLDDVCATFSECLKGDEVYTAKLIEACKAHLIFMKSAGTSLRLVAKDLESNLQKAEKPFKNSIKRGKTLLSLLESEREAGIHKGSILKEQSAAMGLLWIRRSLAFQLELYASLIDQDGPHPRDAAYAAYAKHLSPFHGWALRKLFPATLSKMPDREAFIAMFGGVTLDELNEEVNREVVNKLQSLVTVWVPLIRTWEQDFARLDLEDVRRV